MTLLLNWMLVESVVVPLMVIVTAGRPLAVWAVGPVEDAVAATLGYMRAGEVRSRRPDPRFTVYASGWRRALDPLKLRPSELRGLPDRWGLEPVDGGGAWRPVPRVMDRIVLADPPGLVDLVTLGSTGLRRRGSDAPWARVRRGGHLLLLDGVDESKLDLTGFRRTDRHPGLFRRVAGRVGPVVAEAPGELAVTTLARRQQEAALVSSHLNLARSLAHRFSRSGERRDDLEQVALLALVKAARRYSPEHGPSFTGFATTSIVGELKRHFRDKTWMLRVPRSLQETYLAVKTARDELTQTLGASPTVQQIARHLGIGEEDVLNAMEAGDSYTPRSLDMPVREDGGDGGIEVPVIDPGFDARLERRVLQEALPLLTPTERLIVKRLYFDGLTQRRVAAELGVSQMQISRIMAKTLAKLRHAMAVA